MALDSRRRVYLIDQEKRLPLVVDSAGRLLRWLGKNGEGPGEYLYPTVVLVSAGDTVHILDAHAKRHTLLSPEGHYVRSVRLEGGRPRHALLMDSGVLILNGLLTDRDAVGYPLEALDTRGKRLAAFGVENPEYDIGGRARLQRLLAKHRGGGFWAVSPFEHTVELYAADYAKTLTLPQPSWFVPLGPSEDPSSGLDGGEPTMEVRAIWEDAEGLLWLATVVPDSAWEEALKFAPSKPRNVRGRVRFPHLRKADRFDTVLEVIDPRRGELIARSRINAMVVHYMGSGHVATYHEDSSGIPLIDVWLVHLHRG